MKKRKAIVLFVTLMMMMLLLSIVMVFLNKTKESKDNVSTISALIQTNMIMYDLLQYIRGIELDEYTIFLASKTAIPVNIENTHITFKLDSDQRFININSFIANTKEHPETADKFIRLLKKYKVEKADYFLYLLRDTIDKDIDEEDRDSEIIIDYPAFKNGAVYNRLHLNQIIEYYFEKTGDTTIYDVPFDDYFSYINSSIDLNLAPIEVLQYLLDDSNTYTLTILQDYEGVYEEFEDLPFDEYYRANVIEKGKDGQNFALSTTSLLIKITINYKEQFKSEVSFLYNTNSHSISNYSLDKITILPG